MRLIALVLLLLFATPAFADDSPTARCEALAAHPFEPGRNGVGIETEAMNAPAAILACSAAADEAPDDLAIRYRLARALIKLGSCDDGVAMMTAVAEAGYPPAEAAVGVNYLRQLCGLPRDLHAAFDWSLKAAMHGNAVGQSNLGYLYNCGCVETRNDAQATKWYRAAAEQGYVVGILNYAGALERGAGVPRDIAEAKRLYRKAVAMGEGRAAAQLGYLLLHPESGAPALADITDALAMLDEAVAKGSIDSLITLATWQSENGNDARAVELWTSCLHTGYAICPFELGRLAEAGRGQPADPIRALGLFKLAADMGLPDAMAKVGQFYMRGIGVQQDPKRGEEWLLKAAAYNSLSGVMLVADYYMTTGRADEALRFYRKAAEELGSLDAYTRLAEYYGMRADFDKAYAYGGVVMQLGEPWRKLEMQSLFDALEKMQLDRGLIDEKQPLAPVG